jgi:hypothetical protein
MGKVVVFTSVTLDGVMQAPGRPDEDTGLTIVQPGLAPIPRRGWRTARRRRTRG